MSYLQAEDAHSLGDFGSYKRKTWEKFAFFLFSHIIRAFLQIIITIYMSDVTLIKAIQGDTAQKENQPRFETGMEVEVHQIIREGEKERIQKFKGLIISMRGSSPLTRMITVRSDVDGIGIEKVFPINSPFIAEIKVLRKFKVRRNNIRYIRDLTGKAARLKEIK